MTGNPAAMPSKGVNPKVSCILSLKDIKISPDASVDILLSCFLPSKNIQLTEGHIFLASDLKVFSINSFANHPVCIK